MRRERSRERFSERKGSSSSLEGEPCSSMRSSTSHSPRRRSSCVRCRNDKSSRSAESGRSAWPRGSSRATARRGEPAPVGSLLVGTSLKEIAEAAAADAERQAIRRVLHTTRGNKSEAARQLRTDYKTLHLKMKQYGIDAGPFRELSAS